MKKRIFVGAILGAMMMGVLTGCGKTQEVEQSEKKSINTETVETVELEENSEVEITTEASVNVEIPVYNIGQSPIFSEEQMECGADYVVATFGTYLPECELLDVTYDDAFSSSQDDINKQQYGEADYVVFTTDFTVPDSCVDGPLNAGETYEDYQWILTMNAEGNWELVSSGWQ